MVTQASNVRTGRRLFGVPRRRREQGRIRRSEGLLDGVVLGSFERRRYSWVLLWIHIIVHPHAFASCGA